MEATAPKLNEAPRHLFPKPPTIQQNQQYVEVKCFKCDLIKRIYRSGGMSYLKKNGSTTPILPYDCIEVKVNYTPPTILNRPEEINEPGQSKPPIEKKIVEEVKFFELNKKSALNNFGRHKFPKTEPPASGCLIVECLGCSQRIRIYPNGNRVFIDENGRGLKGQPHACVNSKEAKPEIQEPAPVISIEKIPKPEPVVNSPVKTAFKETVEKQPAYEPNLKPVVQEIKPAVSLNQGSVEAQLKDCIVILKLLYKEVVAKDIECTARQMAGRFLYSQGYQELVKSLNSK